MCHINAVKAMQMMPARYVIGEQSSLKPAFILGTLASAWLAGRAAWLPVV
jgi:hypothetical protein